MTVLRRSSASSTWPASSACDSGGSIGSPAGEISPDVLRAATVGVPYQGPNPPKGEQAHTYVFTLYALNTDKLTLAKGVQVTAEAMRKAMQGRTIGQPAEVRVKFGY